MDGAFLDLNSIQIKADIDEFSNEMVLLQKLFKSKFKQAALDGDCHRSKEESCTWPLGNKFSLTLYIYAKRPRLIVYVFSPFNCFSQSKDVFETCWRLVRVYGLSEL